MELSQGEIIQKAKMQELSSLFMTHHLNVIHASVKFHEYIPYGLGVMARTQITIGKIIQKARVLFLVHDTSSQCDACTFEVS